MTAAAVRQAMFVVRAALGVFLPALAGSVAAQDIESYYTVRHPERFEIDWAGFYRAANERTAALRQRLPHRLDLAYGSDPKQRLDLYLPSGSVDGAPVFLFLHGGGFQEGDRAQYGFVAESFAGHGIITAVASYRLASAGHHYPAPAEDAKNAVGWLHANIASHGGDPESIFVGGHSAGAVLAADLGVDRAWMTAMGMPPHALKGIVPVSGVFDFRSDERPGYIDAYAPTADVRERATPLTRILDPAPAAVVAVGGEETSVVPASGTLAAGLSAKGVQAELLVLENEDHDETVLSLADESDPLFRAILEMVRRARASR